MLLDFFLTILTFGLGFLGGLVVFATARGKP